MYLYVQVLIFLHYSQLGRFMGGNASKLPRRLQATQGRGLIFVQWEKTVMHWPFLLTLMGIVTQMEACIYS